MSMFEYSWRFLHTNKYKIHFGNWNMEIEKEHLENQKKKLKSFEPAGSLKTGWFVRFTGWTAGSSSPIPVQSPSGLMTEPERWLVGGPTGQSSSVFKTMLKTNKSRHNVLTIKMKTSSQIHQQSNRPCHHGKCWT